MMNHPHGLRPGKPRLPGAGNLSVPSRIGDRDRFADPNVLVQLKVPRIPQVRS